MTLAELEAVAARFKAALSVLSEARALLGGQTEVAPPGSIGRRFVEQMAGQAGETPQSTVEWTPAELAEREKLRRARIAELPENIRKLEES
jgi:hypothetical protein